MEREKGEAAPKKSQLEFLHAKNIFQLFVNC